MSRWTRQRLALGSGFEVPPYGAGLGYLTAGTLFKLSAS